MILSVGTFSFSIFSHASHLSSAFYWGSYIFIEHNFFKLAKDRIILE